jgi:valyl-tRNA synthetase
VRLPIADRSIPIVADHYADPEKGSGAVKITPAHDFNDFQVGKRQGLAVLNILDDRAQLNENVPPEFRGMDRFAARKAVVARMEELGLLRGIEPTRHAVPHGDRSGAVIEPYLTDQWYVDAETLAQPAIAAVEDGRTKFVPPSWDRTYFQWMRNIEPWCVSRQLWWGHRIPAWYDPEGFPHVAETEEEARAAALAMHGREVELRQDEDVLDTWFSSALWPFSTLGWPEQTEDLRRFYPTDTLVTASDIIFFWVARMMMMGLHFPGHVPFRRVFITALIRDEKGQKMSKSKGNVIDPLELVEEFGADALRFTLTAMSSGGRDIKMSRARVEGYRNFGTKLWNAARFCQMNGCVLQPGFDPAEVREPLNRWIRGEAAKTAAAVTAALEACAFDDAAEALYRFIWNTFCDWHLELAKPVLQGEDDAAKAETRATTAWALDQACLLLHPISPFLTEELWQRLAESAGVERETPLITAAWPDYPASYVDAEAGAEIDWAIALVTEVRSIRAEMNVTPAARLGLILAGASVGTRARLGRQAEAIKSLARLRFAEPAELALADAVPTGGVSFVLGEATATLSLPEEYDFAAERARLGKEIAGHAAEAAKVCKKLDNPDFLSRAKPEVVEENRARLAEAETAMAKLRAALARLDALGPSS